MPDSSQKPNNQLDKWRVASLGLEMGLIVALPLLLFIFIGKYLDVKFHSTPWLTLLGIILAIASTTVWLTRRLKEFIK